MNSKILVLLFGITLAHKSQTKGPQNRLYNRQEKLCKKILDHENEDKPERFSQDTELTVIVSITITEGETEKFERIMERILNKSKREEHLLSVNMAIDGDNAVIVGVWRDGASYLEHITENEEQSDKLYAISGIDSVMVSGVVEDLEVVKAAQAEGTDHVKYFELNSGSIRA